MLNNINAEMLIQYGFVEIELDQSYNLNFLSDKNEVWQYKSIVLIIDRSEPTPTYRFSDKGIPQFSLMIKDEFQLHNIVKHVDNGASIGDMMALQQESRRKEVEMMMRYPDHKPYLEDFRYNDIGGSFFTLLSQPEIKVMMTYDKHSNKAFYYSLDDIRCLENSNYTVHTGVQTHSSISFWFLALESYINSLIKLCCLKRKENFKLYKDQNLHTRLSSLVDLLGLNKKKFNQTGIIGKVHEFTQFRNELFHDRYFGEEIEFKKTQFSGIPILCCQVDIIQSATIVIEVASLLRFAIKGIDTMLSVVVKNNEFASWEKIDTCYKEILEPYFRAVLEKHHLSTKLNTKLTEIERFESDLFQHGEIECKIVADQEAKYDFTMNDSKTNYVSEFYQKYIRSLNYEPGTIRMQRVMTKPNDIHNE